MSDVKISEVVLYRCGVGFFAATGMHDSKELKLFFKQEALDDLLKSLIVLVKGDKVRNVAFDSKVEINEILRSLSITVPTTESFKGLLRELVGEEVEIALKESTILGKIVGTESEETEKREVFVALIKDHSGKINVIRSLDIQGISIRNEKLQKDLDIALETISNTKRENIKAISINFTSEEQKDVFIGFIGSIPSWKIAYRLIHSEDEAAIQGWAIVDNTTTNDWDNVMLTLVTGLPISFVYDLYSPWRIMRPRIERPSQYGIEPVIAEGTLEDMTSDRRRGMRAKKTKAEKEYAPPAPAPTSGMAFAADLAEEFDKSVQTAATTEEVGDFFVFKIDSPVKILRNQSALVPLFQAKVPSSKIAYYVPGKTDKNPLSCLKIVNDSPSNIVIEAGPATVFIDNAYSGECMMSHLRVGDESLLNYALEQEVLINRETRYESRGVGVDISKEYIAERLLEKQIITYDVKNKKKEKLILIIDEPKSDFKPIGKELPIEKTNNYLRYQFTLEPKETFTAKLELERVRYTSTYKAHLTKEDLDRLLADKLIQEHQYAQLLEIIKIKKEIKDLEQEEEHLETMVDAANTEQQRLRENIKALGTSEEEVKLRKNYVNKLSEQETEIEKLVNRRAEIRKKLIELNKKLSSKLK
ncbi:hypothetical protein [Candidatus Borrarchaeum sp.]|uniref:hypothetical protein n=1 Tax=Candidatus Borrarchaeum sp. TaxID=2846742 RepID=UPI00257F657C|nr:hypothetical protein [Candidatus Borrarchaeum sp.]